MIEALSLLLSALLAASPANDVSVIEEAAPSRTEDARGPRQGETTEERIARMRARFGVRSVRVSTVRCGEVTCHDGCEAKSCETAESDPVPSEPTDSRYRRVSADSRSCTTGVSKAARYNTAEASVGP